MCTGGGGASKAKIKKVNKKQQKQVSAAVDQMAAKVKGLLDSNSNLALTQQLAESSGRNLQSTLQDLTGLARMAADSQQLLQQDAARMSALIGPPPPEKSADRPVIGRNRDQAATPASRGRRQLRIERDNYNTLSM